MTRIQLIRKLINCQVLNDNEKENLLKQFLNNWLSDDELLEKIKFYDYRRA